LKLAELHWLQAPVDCSVGDDSLRILAGPRTDWFVDPRTEALNLTAPALVGPVRGDFVLAADVEVAFAATFDAGALVLWQDERTWAKLCLEYSPEREPMIVSVVTRGTSDDCNSVVVAGGAALRVARIGRAVAFHVSIDGQRWQLVRHFRFDADEPLVGFEAQSPRGEGCAATFSHIRFEAATLGDLRSGE
jgi:uncharacterized protein